MKSREDEKNKHERIEEIKCLFDAFAEDWISTDKRIFLNEKKKKKFEVNLENFEAFVELK